MHTISSTEVYAKLIAFKEDPVIVRAKHTSIGLCIYRRLHRAYKGLNDRGPIQFEVMNERMKLE